MAPKTIFTLIASRCPLLSLFFILLVAHMGLGGAFGQTGPQPGATDPMGKPSRYAMFPDHEILAFVPNVMSPSGSPGIQTTLFTLDPNRAHLSPPLSSTLSPAVDSSPPIVAAASGRVLVPDRDQVVYAYRQPGQNVGAAEFLGYANSTYLFDFTPLSARLRSGVLDIAVGDLDKLADSAGDNHDEVVLCWAAAGNPGVRVAVLDYTAAGFSPSGPVAPVAVTQAATSTPIATSPSNSFGSNDSLLACGIGDFDGDGNNEIAVVHVEDFLRLSVTIFRYTNDGAGNRSLVQVSQSSIVPPPITSISTSIIGSVDLAVGDFTGDGRDKMIVATVLFGFDSGAPSQSRIGAIAQVVDSDENLNLTLRETYNPSSFVTSPDPTGPPTMRARVATGLFKFDPASGFDFPRRQFTLAYNIAGQDALRIDAVTVADDFGLSLLGRLDLHPRTAQRFSIAAGAFRGVTDVQHPEWSLAVNTWNDLNNQSLIAVIDIGTPACSICVKTSRLFPTQNPIQSADLPVVAYDADGDSVYLGAPVHFTVHDLLQTHALLQEPPKHALWDQVSRGIVNVSRTSKFNVQYTDKQGTTFATKTTDATDFNVGASVAASAGVTAKEGVDFGLAKTSTQASLDISGKVSYDYDSHKDSYNSSYAASTLTFTGTTSDDDFIKADYQVLDIWRYRFYGITATDEEGNPTNGFYQIVLPGPKLEARGGGLQFDWYQPEHENGNILSYPALSSATFTPADLGSFDLPDGTQEDKPLIPAEELFFGGSAATINLDTTDQTGSGGAFKYSNTMAASLDVKYAAKVTAEAKVGTEQGGELRFSMDFNAHSKLSFSENRTTDATQTNGTGIALNVTSGDFNKGYGFAPVFYVAQDGTLKVTHAIDVLGSAAGKTFWTGRYGGKPDPALNLPQRFAVVSDSYVPNPLTSRKRIRGFFLRKAELNPVTNDFDYLADAPTDGDVVRIEVRVYNYSVSQAANNVKVRFQAVGYDDSTDTEIGQRVTIGETFIDLLPLEMTTASINWNTAGFGPGIVGASASYRLYVVLDPDNTIDEIYGDDSVGGSTCDDPTKPGGPRIACNPGQNNEGWGLISISSPPPSSQVASAFVASAARAAAPPQHGPDVRLHRESLAAIGLDGELHTERVRACVNQPLRLRIHTVTDRLDTRHYHLLIHDSNPDKKNAHLIAGKLIHGVDEFDGGYMWVYWIPTRQGTFQLYAQLIEKRDDRRPGNNTDQLEVTVHSSTFSRCTPLEAGHGG